MCSLFHTQDQNFKLHHLHLSEILRSIHTPLHLCLLIYQLLSFATQRNPLQFQLKFIYLYCCITIHCFEVDFTVAIQHRCSWVWTDRKSAYIVSNCYSPTGIWNWTRRPDIGTTSLDWKVNGGENKKQTIFTYPSSRNTTQWLLLKHLHDTLQKSSTLILITLWWEIKVECTLMW